jgi:hypothetical protein
MGCGKILHGSEFVLVVLHHDIAHVEYGVATPKRSFAFC